MEQEPFGSRCSQCDALLPEDNAFDYVCERCVKDVRDDALSKGALIVAVNRQEPIHR